ncbi:site-specific integrase [Salinimonas chungwhensis]|uniref:hypothetical protein n=1 Tax=Salinimonas chungwhensis TaxID=265425 RepID=UPI0003633C86|nr:hypothetical protein [Salinimonas chungwhensis]
MIETIGFQTYEPRLAENRLEWVNSKLNPTKQNIPMIFYSDGSPAVEINRYAVDYAKLYPQAPQAKTLLSKINHLNSYIEFLEREGLYWRYFPRNKSESVLFKFRQYLIGRRDSGGIAPSTANARMNAVVGFYRYAQSQGWIQKNLWQEKSAKISIVTAIGFERAVGIKFTNLTIPYRKRNSLDTVEDGLVPLSAEDKSTLLDVAIQGNCHLYLMLQIGFITGARSETIRTLNKNQLLNATLSSDGFYRMTVGPGTGILTKFSVNGELQIPKQLYDVLCGYSVSEIRASRSLKANNKYKDLIFLTTHGNPYSKNTLNQLIFELKASLFSHGYQQFKNFHFHQTRATAITERMLVSIEVYGIKDYKAIESTRLFAMHKSEATTWRYFKFIESKPKRSAAGNAFIDYIFGLDKISNKFNR